MGQQMSGPDSSSGRSIRHESEGWGFESPLRSRHFLSLNIWHFRKNIHPWVENECCCPSIVNVSNVNFTSKIPRPLCGTDYFSFTPLHKLVRENICNLNGGGWGCEVSCGGHHHWPRGKTTTGSALDGAVFDITQILAYLVHNMSRSQLYLGFGHFGWFPSFFGQ